MNNTESNKEKRVISPAEEENLRRIFDRKVPIETDDDLLKIAELVDEDE